jgi:hypothetical protein
MQTIARKIHDDKAANNATLVSIQTALNALTASQSCTL